jgi:hypothetical protein
MHSARRRQAYELRELAFIDPDKRHAFSDPEFRAILLEYDAAFEWSSDDPWLDAVADRSIRWLTAQGSRSGGEERPHDATVAQLLATTLGVSSPAWDRLTEIA